MNIAVLLKFCDVVGLVLVPRSGGGNEGRQIDPWL